MLKLRHIPHLSGVLTLACVPRRPDQQERVDHKELPNFHQVNDQLYRGAQPGKGGLQKIVNLGLKAVVNLRGKGEGVQQEELELGVKG